MNDMDHTNQRRRRIINQILAAITKDTERGSQKSVGPSEIAGRCDHCLGKALTRKYPELDWEEPDLTGDRFSLKAWLGTAIHEKLERDHTHGEHEQTVHITDLDGYGPIKGHCDLFVDHCVVDYKSKDMRVLDGIKLNGPPKQEVFQINLYALGFANAGEDVRDVGLVYIPRDSNRIDDVHAVFGKYNPQIAERVLLRLDQVWTQVREGKGELLPTDKDCFSCKLRTNMW